LFEVLITVFKWKKVGGCAGRGDCCVDLRGLWVQNWGMSPEIDENIEHVCIFY
jgi:hypothetical protein